MHSLKQERQNGQVKVRIRTSGSSSIWYRSFMLPFVQELHVNFPHAAHSILVLSPNTVGISSMSQKGISHMVG